MNTKATEYVKINLKTKNENFVLMSNSLHIYDLYVMDFDLGESGHFAILNKLAELGKDDVINIHISSHGGATGVLTSYINLLTRTPATVNGYLNFGYSCGALLFGVCQNRYCFEYSKLMYHTYSAGAGGKSQEIKSSTAISERVLHKLMKKFYLGISKKEFNKMCDGKDFWFDTDEMIQRKIATLV